MQEGVKLFPQMSCFDVSSFIFFMPCLRCKYRCSFVCTTLFMTFFPDDKEYIISHMDLLQIFLSFKPHQQLNCLYAYWMLFLHPISLVHLKQHLKKIVQRAYSRKTDHSRRTPGEEFQLGGKIICHPVGRILFTGSSFLRFPFPAARAKIGSRRGSGE